MNEDEKSREKIIAKFTGTYCRLYPEFLFSLYHVLLPITGIYFGRGRVRPPKK